MEAALLHPRSSTFNGLSLAKSVGAKVQVILVDAPMHAEEIKRQATHALKHAAEQARLAGVPRDTIQVEHDHLDQPIVAAAKDKDCDLIIMASHGAPQTIHGAARQRDTGRGEAYEYSGSRLALKSPAIIRIGQ